ncbi:MAG: glycoside hydrolase family 31 protein [Prolixibacteraceae bacterium]
MRFLSLLVVLFQFLFFGFGIIPGALANDHPGDFKSYEVIDNKVVFQFQNQLQLQVEQISSGTLRFWYDTDNFHRNNASFAVIKTGDSSLPINISEQPGSVEIYTGELIVRITKSPFQIRIFDKWQKLLLEDFQGRGFESDSSKMSCFKMLKSNESIFGLGEKSGTINRVGGLFKMWNSDKPCYQVDEDPLYKSIPFFMSSEGYGIYFDNTFKTEFDFGATSPDYYSFSSPGGEMDYYFMYGPSYKQIISAYTELTGKPIMPPAWALGFAQCRGLLTNEKLSREIADGYREREIPCDIIYQDIGWTQYLQDFEWRDENYTDPVQMIDDLGAAGFKVIVSQDPVISQANEQQWNEADSLGYFTKDIRTNKSYNMPWPWGGNCGVVDFTQPEVADWWGNYQQKAIDAGVRGFWTDMGEPAWSNVESTERLFQKLHLGMHNEIHNVYGLTWDKVVTEQFEKRNPNQRIFQMTRSAFAGMQRYTFGWSGDAGNGNKVTDGWDQLAAQIPLSLSAGMGLIPFWSCDISGYCGDIDDYDAFAELYLRWLQFGAFNSLSRIHHEGNNAVEPWRFGAEVEAYAKKAIEMKYQLFPYLYSYSRQAYDTGLPIMRALLLEYPNDKETQNLNHQFLFGEELLVAPIVEEGQAERKIYLPKGEWIDFNNKTQSFPGEQWIMYPVEIASIPIFVKKGSIIPQMPVMQYIGEHVNYPLILEIFPAAINQKAEFVVYEDDGETNNYKNDCFLQRNIQCKSKRDQLEIDCSEQSENGFEVKNRNLIYKIYLPNKPELITLEGKKIKFFKWKANEENSENIRNLEWTWNEQEQYCLIRVPAAAKSKQLIIRRN